YLNHLVPGRQVMYMTSKDDARPPCRRHRRLSTPDRRGDWLPGARPDPPPARRRPADSRSAASGRKRVAVPFRLAQGISIGHGLLPVISPSSTSARDEADPLLS